MFRIKMFYYIIEMKNGHSKLTKAEHRKALGTAERVKYNKDHKKKGARKGMKRKGCLLYTSPSPRDRTRSRMPSSA